MQCEQRQVTVAVQEYHLFVRCLGCSHEGSIGRRESPSDSVAPSGWVRIHRTKSRGEHSFPLIHDAVVCPDCQRKPLSDLLEVSNG
jgi:hypothetical protein